MKQLPQKNMNLTRISVLSVSILQPPTSQFPGDYTSSNRVPQQCEQSTRSFMCVLIENLTFLRLYENTDNIHCRRWKGCQKMFGQPHLICRAQCTAKWNVEQLDYYLNPWPWSCERSKLRKWVSPLGPPLQIITNRVLNGGIPATVQFPLCIL